VNFAAKLVHTRRDLSSTVINSHQEPVSGQPLELQMMPMKVLMSGLAPRVIVNWVISLLVCKILLQLMQSMTEVLKLQLLQWITVMLS
jgi:hypothetical protein